MTFEKPKERILSSVHVNSPRTWRPVIWDPVLRGRLGDGWWASSGLKYSVKMCETQFLRVQTDSIVTICYKNLVPNSTSGSISIPRPISLSWRVVADPTNMALSGNWGYPSAEILRCFITSLLEMMSLIKKNSCTLWLFHSLPLYRWPIYRWFTY